MSDVAVLIAGHAVVATLSAVVLASAVRVPQRGRLVPLFLGICACVPVLGQVGLWAGVVLPLRRTRQTKPRKAPDLTPLPSLPADAPGLDRPVDAGPVRAIVAWGRDVDRRLRAITSTRRWDDRAAVPSLLAGLKDPVDDIRLLAYGLLDGRVQRIARRIESAGAQRGRAGSQPGSAFERQVAFDTWELVHARLLRGAAADQALSDALRSAEIALSFKREDPALQLRRGRMLLQRKQQGAADALRAAVRHGLPMAVVAPYLAEEAFQRRAFHEVPGLLALSIARQRESKLKPLHSFWLRSSDQELLFDIPLAASVPPVPRLLRH